MAMISAYDSVTGVVSFDFSPLTLNPHMRIEEDLEVRFQRRSYPS